MLKRIQGMVSTGIIALLLMLAGCGEKPASSGDAPARSQAGGNGPYTIVTTVGMITDIVRNVAGDRAEVVGLMGAGVDPHLYKPTRSDLQRLRGADVVFYNGLMLEGKMTDSLVGAASGGKKVTPVTERIDKQYLLEPEGFHGLYDPHVWMDPEAWAKAVEAVRDSLIEYDPAGESEYRENAAAYLRKMNELDAYAVRVLESVPQPQRVLITAHDAFNYFGRRFGYEVVGIQGLSTESEAGVQDIEKLVNLLVERKVGAVFVESTVSERNISALIAGARARGHTVIIGGELFSDAMGDDGAYEGTYIGMIDHNVTTIARSLGGNAPERGMDGMLSEQVDP